MTNTHTHTMDCAVRTTDRFLSSVSPFICVESNSGVADPGAAAAWPSTRVILVQNSSKTTKKFFTFDVSTSIRGLHQKKLVLGLLLPVLGAIS